jgi:hypothetical protein
MLMLEPCPGAEPGPCTQGPTCWLDGVEHWHTAGPGTMTVPVGWTPGPEATRSPVRSALSRPRVPRIAPPPLPSPTPGLMAGLLGRLPAQSDTAAWGERARAIESLSRWCHAHAARAAVGVRTALELAERASDLPAVVHVEELAAMCLAAETQCSLTAAERRLDNAAALVDTLPRTWAQLAAGQVSVGVALAVAELTAELEPGVRDAVEEQLWPAQLGRTPGEIRRVTRRTVARLDPAALREETRQAAEQRCIEIALHGPHQALGTITITDTALRCHSLYAQLTRLAGPADASGTRSGSGAADVTLDQRRIDALFDAVQAASPTAAGTPGATPATRTSPAWFARCHVQLTIDTPTLLGLADTPATIHTPGVGTTQIPGPLAREAARAAARNGLPVDRLLLDTATGSILQTTRISGRSRSAARAAPTPGSAPPGSAPPGCGTGLPSTPPADTYRPGAALRRHLDTRDPCCAAPGCHQPSHHCDHDHQVPHHHGGPTTAENMAPLCRTHHRAKQHPLVRLNTVLTHTGAPVRTWTYPTGTTTPTTPPDQR